MKILYISEIFPDPQSGLGFWGGGERQFYELARRAARKGHNVTVLTCKFPGQTDSDSIEGIEVRRVGLSRDPRTGSALRSPLKVIRYLVGTAKEAINVECDIIHCNAYYPVIAGRVAAEIRRVPLVCTFHDVPNPEVWTEYSDSRLWGTLGYSATRMAVAVANGPLVAVSEQVRKKLRAIGKTNIDIIPNGVDLDLLDSSHSRRIAGQILYVGRLVSYKRVDLLLESFAELNSRAPGARLVIVGDGPEMPILRALGRTVQNGVVEFLGTVPSHEEVARLFRESTIFVLPSIIEGEGVVVKEAMAASLPVIAMNVPGSGVLGVLRDGWNGLLVKPDDPDALSQAIVKLLSDPEQARRIGANGRKTAEGWTWDEASNSILRLYHESIDSLSSKNH